MDQISKSQFKPKALEIMRQVEKSGQPIVITDHGTPTLELRPYAADRIGQDPVAYLKGSVAEYIDPTEPVAVEDWQV
jgi:prevent-host-death family protein